MPTILLQAETHTMTWGHRFKSAEPYIIGIGVPIAAVLLATCFPLLYSQGQQISELKGQIEKSQDHFDDVIGGNEKLEATQFANLSQRFDDRFGNLHDELDKRFGVIDSSMSQYTAAITQIDQRLDQAELDPRKMLKIAGILGANVQGAFMYRGILYVIPQTNEANQTLSLNGFHSEQLTPALAAYRVTDKVFTPPSITFGTAPTEPPPQMQK